MLRILLLICSLAYVAAQGSISYYGGSNVRDQSPPRPIPPPRVNHFFGNRPDENGNNDRSFPYSPQPVSDRSDYYRPAGRYPRPNRPLKPLYPPIYERPSTSMPLVINTQPNEYNVSESVQPPKSVVPVVNNNLSHVVSEEPSAHTEPKDANLSQPLLVGVPLPGSFNSSLMPQPDATPNFFDPEFSLNPDTTPRPDDLLPTPEPIHAPSLIDGSLTTWPDSTRIPQPDSTPSPDDSSLILQPDSTLSPGDLPLIPQPDLTPNPNNSSLIVQPDSTSTFNDSSLIPQPDSTLSPDNLSKSSQPDSTLSSDDSSLIPQPDSTPSSDDSSLTLQPDSTPSLDDSSLISQPDSKLNSDDSSLIPAPDSAPSNENSSLITQLDSTPSPDDSSLILQTNSTPGPDMSSLTPSLNFSSSSDEPPLISAQETTLYPPSSLQPNITSRPFNSPLVLQPKIPPRPYIPPPILQPKISPRPLPTLQPGILPHPYNPPLTSQPHIPPRPYNPPLTPRPGVPPRPYNPPRTSQPVIPPRPYNPPHTLRPVIPPRHFNPLPPHRPDIPPHSYNPPRTLHPVIPSHPYNPPPILQPVLTPRSFNPLPTPQPGIPPRYYKPMATPQPGIAPRPYSPPSILQPGISPHPHNPNITPRSYSPIPASTIKPPVLIPQNPLTPVSYNFSCSRGNGYYGIPSQCDTYIECQENVTEKFLCPDGLHFNPRTPYPEYPCSYPSEVKCNGTFRQKPKPTNECRQQYGFYAAPDGDCSVYLMCQGGRATVMHCPLGLVFNEMLSSCDWPVNVPNCNPDAFKGFSCPTPTEDEFYSTIYKYRYGRQCKRYIACQRGHPRLLSCDEGLSFDEESQLCVAAEFVADCDDVM